MENLDQMLETIEQQQRAAEALVSDPAFETDVAVVISGGWEAFESSCPSNERGDRETWKLRAHARYVQGTQELFEAAVEAKDVSRARAMIQRLRSALWEVDTHAEHQALHHFVDRYARRETTLASGGIRIDAEIADAVVLGCLQDTDALVKTRAWLENSREGSVLALLGGMGIGKTVAASWALLEAGGKCLRSDELAFLSGSNYSADRDRFRELVTVQGLLVVDDVGTERDAAKARHGLFDLVDIRQGKGMRTILTSNLAADDFRERFCSRTLARLKAVGGMRSCGGPDLRGAQ